MRKRAWLILHDGGFLVTVAPPISTVMQKIPHKARIFVRVKPKMSNMRAVLPAPLLCWNVHVGGELDRLLDISMGYKFICFAV